METHGQMIINCGKVHPSTAFGGGQCPDNNTGQHDTEDNLFSISRRK
jgi:hypothetical protein